jgi:hypothetical protein
MEQLEILLVKDELRELKARYWRFVDTKQWDAFVELFADGATFADHGADFRCADREEIATKIPAALERVISIHHGHQHELEILDADRAKGIWVMEDYLIYSGENQFPGVDLSTSAVHGYGHYVEEYARHDGAWKFAKIDLYRLRLEVESLVSNPLPEDLRG